MDDEATLTATDLLLIAAWFAASAFVALGGLQPFIAS